MLAHAIAATHDRLFVRLELSLVLALLLPSLLRPSSAGLASSARDKRSFLELDCRGSYHSGRIVLLERVCEDCYNLFKQAEVYGHCRMQCFSTNYFKKCLRSLLLIEDQEEHYLELVDILGKR